MADGFATATQAALRAALISDAGVLAFIGDRVVDEAESDIVFPYAQFASIVPRADDTDHVQGAIVQVGLEVHSRPKRPLSGRVEAARICEAIQASLHRKTDLNVAGFRAWDVQVQTWAVDRDKDGKTYLGRIALEVFLYA